MNCKQVLSAAALSLIIGGAHAATVTLTDDVDANPIVDVFSNSGDLNNDLFEFTLHPGVWNTFDVVVSFAAGSNPAVKLDGGTSVFLSLIDSPTPYIYKVGFGGLSGGLHSLAFSGFSSGTASVSVTAVQTSPVPEPETYAMMLAGLGAVGFMARRRKTS